MGEPDGRGEKGLSLKGAPADERKILWGRGFGRLSPVPVINPTLISDKRKY